MALTAAARHLGPQLSPLISRTLPDVAPPTTWVARMSFYPPKQRMRCVSGFAFSQPARRHSLPNRVRFTAHRQFASGCSPPRFAATQLPSTTGPWLTPTWTLTMLCTRLHGRTGSPAPGAMHFPFVGAPPPGRWVVVCEAFRDEGVAPTGDFPCGSPALGAMGGGLQGLIATRASLLHGSVQTSPGPAHAQAHDLAAGLTEGAGVLA